MTSTQRTATGIRLRSAYAPGPDTAAAVRQVATQLGLGAGTEAAAVLFFASAGLDSGAVAGSLAAAAPGVPLIGCSTAGEFTEQRTGTGGLAAIAIPRAVAPRAAAALADLSEGVDRGIRAATVELESQLDLVLRQADPSRYVGIMLLDGMHGTEEQVNEAIGNVAPLLSFVGGSAGDDLAFSRTTVSCGAETSANGAALLVLDVAAPFTVVKTCSFEPTEHAFVATRVDTDDRIVWELDGRTATDAYAEAVGCPVDELTAQVFMSHPLGLMIDGKPWIRSPQQVVPGGGIKFYCQIVEGMPVALMDSTDLVQETAAALRTAAGQVGGTPSGAIMFNCILRRLEIDANGWQDGFVQALGGVPTAGFHTYGESWLGHMNQTLTGVLFG
jgi:hypothetical protein